MNNNLLDIPNSSTGLVLCAHDPGFDRKNAEDAIENEYGVIRYQGAYVQERIDETGCSSFNVEAANQIFFDCKKYKKQGIMPFRVSG